jgi:L-serine dehydratase
MARELDLRPPVLGLLLETAYARRRDGARISPVHVWKRAASKLATVMFTAVELGRRGRNDLRVLKGDWAKSLSSRVSILGAGWQAFTAAIAAQEFNGGMGLISAAPTGGASGALPGTIWAVGRATNARENAQVEALFVAGLVGLVAFGRGPVSGAQAGCGSEIGVGAGMAAGAAAWLMGADWEEIEAAAALAAMNFIGIECSPERGCVEYPCVPRNGFAALCAIAAAEAACGGIKPPHDLDSTYDRIFGIGRLLPACLRETEDGVWMASALGRRGANEE